MSRERSNASKYAGLTCSAPDCSSDAIIATMLGPCCNKHYLRVITHGGFTLPARARSRDATCAICAKPFDRGYSMNAKRAANNQFCSPACRATHAANESAADMPERFWSFVGRRGEKECWLWNGSLNANGYGQFTWVTAGKRTHIATRIAYRLVNGEIPPKMFVCHSCDNPRCVNPAHLWLGTAKDNMQDASKKGRIRSGGLRGEAHGCAKLNEISVREIRASNLPRKALANHYGVTPEAISLIVKRKTWRHV